jgi:hypothetical protein
MPVARVFVERVDEDGDGYRETRRTVHENLLAVFSVDATSINPAERLVLSGEIEHDTPVRRSGYIGDKLYSIASDSIKVVDVTALNNVIATVITLPLPEEDEEDDISPPPVLGSGQFFATTEQLVGRFPAVRPDSLLLTVVDRARADLAMRLTLGSGAPLLVSAEGAPEAPGGGFQLAFRVGEDHYLYRAGTNGNVQLIDNDYEFSGDAWHAIGSFDATPPPAGLPGDFNRDNRVDDQDRLVWRANFGAWSLTSYLQADGNHDGTVNAADFAVWRNNRGAVAQSAAAGDFDASGTFDQADYLVWRSTFGSTTDLRADANRDNQVDTADYSIWRRARSTSIALGQALDELLVTASALGGTVSPATTSALEEVSSDPFSIDEVGSDEGLEAIDAALESIESTIDVP